MTALRRIGTAAAVLAVSLWLGWSLLDAAVAEADRADGMRAQVAREGK